MKLKTKLRGFSLLEMLLVMVIVGMILMMGINYLRQRTIAIRIDKATLQMQQILNASLAYYVANGEWPYSLGCLQGKADIDECKGEVKYLPDPFPNPWGNAYRVAAPPDVNKGGVLYAFTLIESETANTDATIIAGRLPLAYVFLDAKDEEPPAPGSCLDRPYCHVIASVNLPGQDLNNATAVNFAGLYKHGGCVPVPRCPLSPNTGKPLTPQIIVAPVSVSGINDNDLNGQNIYPISSFTAYAKNDNLNDPDATPKSVRPLECQPTIGGSGISSTGDDCTSDDPNPSKAYWRVCLQVITEKGDIQKTNTQTNPDLLWGQYVTLMAITRCAIENEPAGSTFNVYSN